jgi:hypothetical protein
VQEQVDTLLLPVARAYQDRQTQMQLDTFVTITHRFAKIRSKRLQAAVAGVSGAPLRDELAVAAGDAAAAAPSAAGQPAQGKAKAAAAGAKRKRPGAAALDADAVPALRKAPKRGAAHSGGASQARSGADNTAGDNRPDAPIDIADSDEGEALLNDDGTLKVPQPEASSDHWEEEGWDDEYHNEFVF